MVRVFGILAGMVWFVSSGMLTGQVQAVNTLTVATFNTTMQWTGYAGDVAEFVVDHGVEVLAIQETDKDSYDALLDALTHRGWPMEGKYRGAAYVGDHHKAVVSRYPIEAYEVISFPASRPIQTFVINHPQARIRFVHIHPVPGNSCPHHEQYLQSISSRFSNEALILFGDFNMGTVGEHASCYQAYSARFTDACTTGQDPSCADSVNDVIHSGAPGQDATIDHIFIERATLEKGHPYVWIVNSARIANQITYPQVPQTSASYRDQRLLVSGKTGAAYTPFFSDHFPVVAQIAFVPPSPTPTITPSPTATPPPLPTEPPVIFPTVQQRILPLDFASEELTCDVCGYCRGNPKPPNYDQCIACLYDMGTVPPTAKDGYDWTVLGCVRATPTGFTQRILQYVFAAAGGIAFLRFAYGCFLLMTASGKPLAYEDAKQVVTSSLVGLFIVLFSVMLMGSIGVTILAIPGFSR